MIEDFDRDSRKSKKKNNQFKKTKRYEDISEEQKFISKSKKAFKHKIEDIRGDELWQDWEDMDK